MIKFINGSVVPKALIVCVLALGINNIALAEEPGNRIFFRGGYAKLTEDRAGGVFTDLASSASGAPINDNDDGWYFGAGFDFLLSKDTLGLLPVVWTLAELGLEFRHLGSKNTIVAGPTLACLAISPTSTTGLAPLVENPGCAVFGEQDLTMFIVTAAPKLKFREGSKLRPWIIPAGASFMVISPPSDSTNYLDMGIMFAAGFDYMLIPGITLGVDARYHWAADLTDPELSVAGFDDDQDNDAWTLGVSLGISF